MTTTGDAPADLIVENTATTVAGDVVTMPLAPPGRSHHGHCAGMS